MKKQLLLLVMMLLPMVVSAAAVEIDGIYYNLISKVKIAEVTSNPYKYTGDVVIPESVTYEDTEYNVTSIGNSAFYYCQNLTSVTIPNSITSIGNSAFMYCTSLSSIDIPNSVTSLGEDLFRECSALTSVSIGNGVTKIDSYTFGSCSSLISIDIPNSVTTISSSAFNCCTSLTSINIPNSVTTIGDYAFNFCSALKNIVIPNCMTYISSGICSHCSSLTSVTIPNNVTYISSSAFQYCTDLKIITIGSSVDYISSSVFASCPNLTDVFCFAESVPNTASDAFENSYANYAELHVPAASVSSYSGTAPWSDFNTIESIVPENIAIGDLGIGTFCGSNPLDLSSTEDVKAYVVSSFESATGQVTLTRTYYVPPFTGVVVKGNKGIYTIPAGVGQPVYPNMMKGVTANIVLNKVDGDYTNYILAKKNGNLGFYAVSDGSTLSARKAYLPLPTVNLPSGAGARGLQFIYDDEQATDITEIESKNDAIVGIYNLQGRKVINPTKGLYVINGKKVIIK